MREPIKAGKVFITNRTREAIHIAAAERTDPELKDCFELLHESMDQFGKRIAAEEINGQDFIIYTPERRIGKTEAALYLAHEYDMHYVVNTMQLDFVRQQAKEEGYNIRFVSPERLKDKMDGTRIRTVVKDECIKTSELRQKIGERINIIGIEEI